jgi:mono/diheme cytochrome c family protein
MGLKRAAIVIVVAGWAAALGFRYSAVTVQAGAAAQQPASGERKIWEGVYTVEQAERGKPRFEAACIRCHNIELIGSERGPALKGNAFLAKYENDSLASLYTLIRDTMPRDGGAAVVSDIVKVDMLAYILQRNDVPAGKEELKLDMSALEGIKISKKGVWDGVYTAAQAERGKANFLTGRCGGCHQLDLSGDRGPTLKGDGFLSHWENGPVSSLFKKISETMPPNGPNETTDEAKIDIVAFLLQSNGFPPGATELALDPLTLERIEIVKKGLIATAPNFALVQVVGCLTQGPNNNAWVLTRTSDPVVTKDEAPSPGLLKTAAAKPLGDQTYQLVSVTPFKPEAHKGHKVEARGLLYRDPTDARLNLTSLQMVAESCPN